MNKENNKKKKFNKKYLLFGLPILALGLVVALTYYAVFSVSVNVNQPIEVTGDGEFSVECYSGDTCIGNVVTITNSHPTDSRLVSVLVEGESDNLTTGVVGELKMTSKEIIGWTPTDNKANVSYTIVGDKFNFKVDSELVNYVLVYYPDVDSAKTWNIANAVNLGDAKNTWTTIDSVNLPIPNDYNANPDEGNSYCSAENGFDDYLHCSGAKFWLMPKVDFDSKAWNPTAWLFETDLITYTDNTLGTTDVLVLAGESVSVYPQVTVDGYAGSGNYPITITVA